MARATTDIATAASGILVAPDARVTRILTLLLALLLGCREQSEEEKLIRAASPVKSWASSLAYAGELWLGNRVPKSFVVGSAESALKETAKAQHAADTSRAPAVLRARVRHSLDEFADSAAALRASVRNHDPRITAREVERCHRLFEELEALQP